MMNSLSPVDGRYSSQVDEIRAAGFTEGQLILAKARIELKWLMHLSELFNERPELISETGIRIVPNCRDLVAKILDQLEGSADFQEIFLVRVQEIERSTKHDTKAVELALREILIQFSELKPISELTHIGLTSEDVTGTAYSLMFQKVYTDVLQKAAKEVGGALARLADATKECPLLSLTHGQPATPSTFGKEIAVFLSRLMTCDLGVSFKNLAGARPAIKFGGAVGTHGALSAAFPDVDWLGEMSAFVESSFGSDFELDLCTTQIPCREWMIRKLRVIQIQNSVLIDFSKDIWSYISREILTLHVLAVSEVGSSTMPHKVNPIHFENAEGNLGVANGLIDILATKFGQSRLQRDLSDSTVIRNLGLVFCHTLIAYKSLLAGLERVTFNASVADAELNKNPQILAEAVQTILRKYPMTIQDPYTLLKNLSRPFDGAGTDPQCALTEFIESLRGQINGKDFQTLNERLDSPRQYIGLSTQIATRVLHRWRKNVAVDSA